jgi:hypothetical protein
MNQSMPRVIVRLGGKVHTQKGDEGREEEEEEKTNKSCSSSSSSSK